MGGWNWFIGCRMLRLLSIGSGVSFRDKVTRNLHNLLIFENETLDRW